MPRLRFILMRRCLPAVGVATAITCLVAIVNHVYKIGPEKAAEESPFLGNHRLQPGPLTPPAAQDTGHARDGETTRTGHQTTGSEGYDRARYLREACDKKDSGLDTRRADKIRVSVDEASRLLYCPMCKLASTFWTRFFKMLEMNSQRNERSEYLHSPFDVPISLATASKTIVDLASESDLQKMNSQFKFLFVRNPYSRLFSAFTDKLVRPNPTFWNMYGVPAIKKFRKSEESGVVTCGNDVTFHEFINFLIDAFQTGQGLDCHVAHYDVCNPCGMNYTFVGKMETFKADAMHITNLLGLNKTLEVFKSNFSVLHAYDAIEDVVQGTFSWKNDIVRCMSWHEALKRVWRALQIRGILDKSKFPLSEKETTAMGEKQFENFLKETHRSSSTAMRSQTKEAFEEAYQSLPLSVTSQLQRLYAEEFQLFDYDDTPDFIFQPEKQFRSFSYFNFSDI